MPKLKGSALSPSTGKSRQRVEAGEGELLVGCPLVRPCGWQSVRPLRAVHSAQWAHRIAHERGLV